MKLSSDQSPLATLTAQPADALLALIAMHRTDPRTDKLDLGIGVYRDETGHTPVMRAVKEAERRLLETQTSKGYLGAGGDPLFVTRLAPLVFGERLAEGGSLVGVGTPGGTGALRLGAELYALANPRARVWIGTPTWPNHDPIFRAAGLRVSNHPFYDETRCHLDFGSMMAALDAAGPGDLLLLHGCCHNPTGARLSSAQWAVLAEFCLSRSVIPFIDLAYQGLGDSWDEDARGLRLLVEKVPTALIAYSCDKNFGLYRDRVGGFWLHEQSDGVRSLALQNMLVLARCLWSMPPDHGAAIVSLILADRALSVDWSSELARMRARLEAVRAALAASDPALRFLGEQQGLFALLPLSANAVVALRRDHGIYMAGSGRINLAGLRQDTVPRLAAAVVPLLRTVDDPEASARAQAAA